LIILITLNYLHLLYLLQSFINIYALPNILRYYNEHISLKEKYSPNNIPLLVPSSNIFPSTDITIKYCVELEICIKLYKNV
jgi:hypothetical protein